MKITTILGTSAVLALLAGGTAAFAQEGIGASANLDAEELNEDLLEQIEDDAERELDQFGNEGRPQGLSGSFALRSTLTSGNSETFDLGIGADLNYLTGPNGVEFQLNYAYSEDEDATEAESLVYSLQYTRDLNPNLYGFARLQGSYDDEAGFERDTFLSFGAGYRVINTAETQWAVQAGVGYRYAELNEVTELDFEEPAIGVSSDYAQRLTDTVSLTNDTDIISSESDTVIFNDLAVAMSMTDNMALRTSLLTEFHTDPAEGAEDIDHQLGVSVVYSF